MKNKHVGLLIVGIALLMGFMIWLFNRALTEIIATSCSHGNTCPMWGSMSFHTNFSIALVAFVVAIGLYLFFFSKDDLLVKEIHKIKTIKTVEKKPKIFDKRRYDSILGTLDDPDEKAVMQKIVDSHGTIFQSKLMDAGLSKVKVTRILDRLEGRGIIERRRRGMTNVVILKHN